MALKELSIMAQREEFVHLARQEGARIRELCRRFAISPTTGYKWLRRFEEEGRDGLCDRSRRPHTSPAHTDSAVEEAVEALRRAHPAWGARTLKRRLEDRDGRPLPAASTVHAVLRRRGLLDPAQAAAYTPCQRFEHAAPNDLWQMDFKGHFAVEDNTRCHPLAILDDHSRFCLALQALPDERRAGVRRVLEGVFRAYGLPRRILADNGSPWGEVGSITQLELWLWDLGVHVSHGRPRHPQTQGKDERFHRTLKAELLAGRAFATVAACQAPFDRWRDVYNTERPHHALGLATPVTRYRPSPRSFPETLPAPEYGPDDRVRTVQDGGWLSFQGRPFRLSRALKGRRVAVRPTLEDGCFDVYYRHRQVGRVDLRDPDE